MSERLGQRFSGHESFVCRYGWLPKVFRAVERDPAILKNEIEAMHELGIGRNMVKSIQFWGESTGVIMQCEAGYRPGPVGVRLMSIDGWDHYLEYHESLWLLHWWIASHAKLGAWLEVFGDARLRRFDRKSLVERLRLRGLDKARPLALSTIEQHASIFIQTYLKEVRSNDDTSWCPLQDLGLLSQSVREDGRVEFNISNRNPQGLTERVFAIALLDYARHRVGSHASISLSKILRGDLSPGAVFCLDELAVRRLLDDLSCGLLNGCVRFNDTADTQSLVVDLNNAPEDLLLTVDGEVINV